MPQVSAAEGQATGEFPFPLDGLVVQTERRVFQIDRALRGKCRAVSRDPRREHTVEHVDAARDHLDHLRRRAETHRVTRTILREKGRGVFHRGHHLGLRLSDGDAADRVSIETDLHERLRTLATEVCECRALHDAEFHPRRRHLLAPARPAQRALPALRGVIVFARIRRAFVEQHADVRAERRLDFHRGLRPDETRRSVEMTLKMHAFLRDLAQLREAENLEAARVREDRPIPRHEAMQPAEMPDDLDAGPDEKMVGISENDLRAELPQFLRRHGLHRGLRPDRHEDRRLNDAMRGRDPASSGGRSGIGFQ